MDVKIRAMQHGKMWVNFPMNRWIWVYQGHGGKTWCFPLRIDNSKQKMFNWNIIMEVCFRSFPFQMDDLYYPCIHLPGFWSPFANVTHNSHPSYWGWKRWCIQEKVEGQFCQRWSTETGNFAARAFGAFTNRREDHPATWCGDLSTGWRRDL